MQVPRLRACSVNSVSGSRTYINRSLIYLLGVLRFVEDAVVVGVLAGAPPGAGGDPDAGDMAVRVGLPDERRQGLAVVVGRGQLWVELLRQARHYTAP